MGLGGQLFRRVRAGLVDEPTGFAWVEDKRLAATGYPSSAGQVKWLAAQGIDSVLTLTEAPLPDGLRGAGMIFNHVAMKDHEPPSVQALAEAVSIVEGELKAGRKLAVHCLAGEGRTGCVLAAYYIKDKGMSASEALAAIRVAKPAFVERRQEGALQQYEASVRPGPP